MKVFLLTVSLGGMLAIVMFGVLTDWDASAMSITAGSRWVSAPSSRSLSAGD